MDLEEVHTYLLIFINAMRHVNLVANEFPNCGYAFTVMQQWSQHSSQSTVIASSLYIISYY